MTNRYNECMLSVDHCHWQKTGILTRECYPYFCVLYIKSCRSNPNNHEIYGKGVAYAKKHILDRLNETLKDGQWKWNRDIVLLHRNWRSYKSIMWRINVRCLREVERFHNEHSIRKVISRFHQASESVALAELGTRPNYLEEVYVVSLGPGMIHASRSTRHKNDGWTHSALGRSLDAWPKSAFAQKFFYRGFFFFLFVKLPCRFSFSVDKC